MKKVLLIGLLTLLSIASLHSQNKEYSIPTIRVDVEIKSDGNVVITEHRTYEFIGAFTWADYRLPKRGFSEMRNIRVSDQHGYFINENSENERTFKVSESDDTIITSWYFNVSDTIQTFSLEYELTEAISHGPEWSEFYWNFIASGREKPTRNLEIQIDLPEEVISDSLYTWTRSSSDQIESTKSDGEFTISVSNLSTRQSVSVRSVFPTAVFDENAISVTEPNLTLESIKEDEQRYISEQEQQAYYRSITDEIIIVICIISTAIFLLLYRKYGTRFSSGTISGRETVLIPDSTPPAIIAQLFGYGSATGTHLAATFFDLARRGWFIIQEEKIEKKGYFSSEKTVFRVQKSDSQPATELPKWESMIVDYVQTQLDRGVDRFDKIFEEIQSFGSSKWFSQWKKEISEIYKAKNWQDEKSTVGVVINFIAQCILVAISFIMAILGSTVIAIIGLIFTGLMATASLFIKRRTKAGEETYKRWKAYKQGLKNAKDHTIRMEMMDRHFVYALALSLSNHQIETLMEQVDKQSIDIVFPWIVVMSGSSHTPATISSTVTTLAATTTSTFNAATGGAGATAGAAGGGASGGAG